MTNYIKRRNCVCKCQILTSNADEITVSNWLKNSGDVSGKLTDKSTLNDIKNVKGDEKYTADGDKITWNTDGKDIYYREQPTKNFRYP